jgi:hypothetical protein
MQFTVPTNVDAACPIELPTCVGFTPDSDYPELGMCIALEDVNTTVLPNQIRLYKYPVAHSRYEEREGVGRAACDCLSQQVVFKAVSFSTDDLLKLGTKDPTNLRYQSAVDYFNTDTDIPATSPCDFTTVGWRWKDTSQAGTDPDVLTIPPGDRSENVKIISKSGTKVDGTTVPCGQYTTSPMGSITLKSYCASHPNIVEATTIGNDHYDARLAMTLGITKRMCVLQHSTLPLLANLKFALNGTTKQFGDVALAGDATMWDNITSDTKVHASVAAHRIFHLAMLFDLHVLNGLTLINSTATKPSWHANPDFPSENSHPDYHEASQPYRSAAPTTQLVDLFYKMGSSSHNFGEPPPENLAESINFPGSHFGRVREGDESFIAANPMMSGRLSLLGFRYAASCDPFSSASPFRRHKTREDIDFNWYLADDVQQNPYYSEAVAILTCITVKLLDIDNIVTAAGSFADIDSWSQPLVAANPSAHCSSYGFGEGDDLCTSHTEDWTNTPSDMLIDHSTCHPHFHASNAAIIQKRIAEMASCFAYGTDPTNFGCKPEVLRIAPSSVWRRIAKLTQAFGATTTPDLTQWWGTEQLIWGDDGPPFRLAKDVLQSLVFNTVCQLRADTTQMILLHAKLSYPDLFESSFVTNIGDVIGNTGTGFNCSDIIDVDHIKTVFDTMTTQSMTADTWNQEFNNSHLTAYTTDMFFGNGEGMFQPESLARWQQHCMPQDFQYPGIILNTQYTVPDGIGIHRAVRNGRTARESQAISDTVRDASNSASKSTDSNGNILHSFRNFMLTYNPVIAATNAVLDKAFHIHFTAAVEHFADDVTCAFGNKFAKFFGVNCNPPPPPPPPPTPAPPTRPPPPPPTPDFMTTDGKAIPSYSSQSLPLNWNTGMFYDGTSLASVNSHLALVAYGLSPPNPSFVPYSRWAIMSEAVVVGLWPDLSPWKGDVNGYQFTSSYESCASPMFTKIIPATTETIDTANHQVCGGIYIIPNVDVSDMTLEQKSAVVAADVLCGPIFADDFTEDIIIPKLVNPLLTIYGSPGDGPNLHVTYSIPNEYTRDNLELVLLTFIHVPAALKDRLASANIIIQPQTNIRLEASAGNTLTWNAGHTPNATFNIDLTAYRGIYTITISQRTIHGPHPLVCIGVNSLPRECRSDDEHRWEYISNTLVQESSIDCKYICTAFPTRCTGVAFRYVDNVNNRACWHRYNTVDDTQNISDLNATIIDNGCSLIKTDSVDNFELGGFVPHFKGRNTSSATFAGNPACTHINTCGLNSMYFHTPNDPQEKVIFGRVQDHCAHNVIDGWAADFASCNHHFSCRLNSFCHVGYQPTASNPELSAGEYPARNGSGAACMPCDNTAAFELTALTQHPIPNPSQSGGTDQLPQAHNTDYGQFNNVAYPQRMWSRINGIFMDGLSLTVSDKLADYFALWSLQTYPVNTALIAQCNTETWSMPNFTTDDLGWAYAISIGISPAVLAVCLTRNITSTLRVSGADRPVFRPLAAPNIWNTKNIMGTRDTMASTCADVTKHNANLTTAAISAITDACNTIITAIRATTIWEKYATETDDVCYPTSTNNWTLSPDLYAAYDPQFANTGAMNPRGTPTIDQFDISWIPYHDTDWDDDPLVSYKPHGSVITALYDATDFTAADKGIYAPSRYLVSFADVIAADSAVYGLARPKDFLAQADYTTMFLSDATCRSLFKITNIDNKKLMEAPYQKRAGNCMPFRFVGSDTHTGLAYRRRLFTKVSAVSLGARNPDPSTFHKECVQCAAAKPDVKKHTASRPLGNAFVLNANYTGTYEHDGFVGCALYGCNWAGICADKNRYAWIGGENRGGGMSWQYEPASLQMGINGDPRSERAPFNGPCTSDVPEANGDCGIAYRDRDIFCDIYCQPGSRTSLSRGPGTNVMSKTFYDPNPYLVCPTITDADPANGFDATMPYFDHHVDSESGSLPDIDAVHYFTPREVKFPVIINGVRHVRRRVEHPEYLDPWRMNATKPGFTRDQIRNWCNIATQSQCSLPGRIRSCLWNISGCHPLDEPNCTGWSGQIKSPDNVTEQDKEDCQPAAAFGQCVLIRYLVESDGLKTTIPTAATRHLQHQITTQNIADRHYEYVCAPLAWRVAVTKQSYPDLWKEGILRHPECTFESKDADVCNTPPVDFLTNGPTGLNRQSNMIDTSDWFAFSSPVSYFTSDSTTLVNLTYTVDPDVHTVPTFSADTDILENLHQIATDWWTADYSGVYSYVTQVANTPREYKTEICPDDNCNAAKDQYASFTAVPGVYYPNCGPQTVGTCGVAVDHIAEIECPSRDTGTQWPGTCVKPMTQLYTPDMLLKNPNGRPILNTFDDISTSLPFLRACEFFNPDDGWDRYDPVKWPHQLHWSNDSYTIDDRLLLVHYCDRYVSQYMFCDNDPLSYAERTAVCEHYDGKILIGGRVVTNQLSTADVCSTPSPNTALCYLFPGYPNVGSVAKIIAAVSKDADTITIKVVPFAPTFISNFLFNPKISHTVITNTANTWIIPDQSDTVAFIKYQMTKFGEYGDIFAADVCNTSRPITDNTITALYNIYLALKDPLSDDVINIPNLHHDNTFSTPQSFSNITIPSALVFSSITEYAVKITVPGVSILPAIPQLPILYSGSDLPIARVVRYDVAAAAFTIKHAIFNQSGCTGEPFRCAPIVFSGGDVVDSTVSDIQILHTTLGIAYLGGDTDVFDYTDEIDVSGVSVDKISFYPLTPSCVVAAFARTIGEPEYYSCPVTNANISTNCNQYFPNTHFWCNRWSVLSLPTNIDNQLPTWQFDLNHHDAPTLQSSHQLGISSVNPNSSIVYVNSTDTAPTITLAQISRSLFRMVVSVLNNTCVTLTDDDHLVTTLDCTSATKWHVDHTTSYIHPMSRPFVCIAPPSQNKSHLTFCSPCTVGTESHLPCAIDPNHQSRIECPIENIDRLNPVCTTPNVSGIQILKCTDTPAGAIKAVPSFFCDNKNNNTYYVQGGAAGTVTCPTGTVITQGYGYSLLSSLAIVDTVFYQPHDTSHGANLAIMGAYILNFSYYTNHFGIDTSRQVYERPPTNNLFLDIIIYTLYTVISILIIVWIIVANCEESARTALRRIPPKVKSE